MELINAKSWNKALSQLKATFTAHNDRVHRAACSAVLLAAEHGSPGYLNELHAVMPRLYQDAMRAWLNPERGVFVGKPWLNYSTDKGYYLIKDTVANRPKPEVVQAVADDMSKYMMTRSAGKVANDLSWAEELDKKIKQLLGYVDTGIKSGKANITDEQRRYLHELDVAYQTDSANRKRAKAEQDRLEAEAKPEYQAPAVHNVAQLMQ